MTSHPTHCPACTPAPHSPAFHFPVESSAIAATTPCPNGRVSSPVWSNPLATRPSPDHSSRLKFSRVSSRHRNGGSPKLDRSPVGDTRVSTVCCPHCQRSVTEYRFVVSDGFSIVTHHCAEHGDVIPPHGAGARDTSGPQYV